MKTSKSSFFPTRNFIKLNEAHQQHTYQVVKRNQNSIVYGKNSTEPINIFRDYSNPLRKQDVKKQSFRPVGGKELFKKVDQYARERSFDRKLTKRKTNREFTKNIILTSVPRFTKELQEQAQNLPLQSISQNKQLLKDNQLLAQEFLKSHAAYDPYLSASKWRKNSFTLRSTNKSEKAFRPVTSNETNHQKWTEKQRNDYEDKNAFLNEISFNKPLVEAYGNRYFEFMLRNRFQQDIKPSPFVYLLSNKKTNQSRGMAKLKQYRPDIKQKQMIIVRGRKLRTEGEDL